MKCMYIFVILYINNDDTNQAYDLYYYTDITLTQLVCESEYCFALHKEHRRDPMILYKSFF